MKKDKNIDEKITSIQKSLYSPDFYQAPNRLDIILKKAQKQKLTLFSKTIQSFSHLWIRLRPAYKIGLSLTCFLFAIILFITITNNNSYQLYILKAYGNIKINNKSFFDNNINGYNIKNRLQIKVNYGQCAFQLYENNLIVLEKESLINIHEKTNIHFNLIKGSLLASVNSLKQKRKIVISANNNHFEIIGTEFIIKNNKKQTILKVKSGNIKVKINNQIYNISDNQEMKITHGKTPEIRKTYSHHYITKLNDFVPYNDIKNTKKIIVKTTPEASKVYNKNRIIGVTPLFIRSQQALDHNLFIASKGYISQELSSFNGQDKDIQVKLKKKKELKYIWKKRLANSLLSRSYYFSHISIPHKKKDMQQYDLVDQNIEQYSLEKNNLLLEKGYHNNHPSKPEAPKYRWSLRLNERIFAKPYYIGHFIILTDAKGYTYKIDAVKGKILWTFNPNVRMSSIPYYHKGRIYLSYNNDILYALNYQDGKIIWTKEIGSLVYSAPFEYKNRLYACNNDGVLYCLNKDNGSIIWRKKIANGFFSSFTIENDNLYIGDLTGYIYSINLTDQKINWRIKAGNRIVDSKPLLYKQYILIGSNDEYLYVINKKNGQIKKRYHTDGEIFSSPLLMKNTVLISTIKGTLYAIDIERQKINWQFQTKGRIISLPDIIDNKYIYIGTENKLYILNQWGLIFSDYDLRLSTFTILDQQNICIGDKNGYIYNINLQWNTPSIALK